MNLELSFLDKLEAEKKALQEAIDAEYKLLASLEKKDLKIRAQNRLLYTGLGCILSCVVIAGYVLYQLVVNPTNPVFARDTVVLLFLFGLSLITVWMVES